jgi:hypothetical protein
MNYAICFIILIILAVIILLAVLRSFFRQPKRTSASFKKELTDEQLEMVTGGIEVFTPRPSSPPHEP